MKLRPTSRSRRNTQRHLIEALEPRELFSTTALPAAFRKASVLPVTDTPTSVYDAVNRVNRADYFRFTITALSSATLTLGHMTANADLQLFDAGGTLISASQTPGSGNEAITRTLSAGTYFIRVLERTGSTKYQLLLAASPLPPPPGPGPDPTAGVKVQQVAMNSYTELDITGTGGDDIITLSQDGNTLTITANGTMTTLSADFGDLVIHGGDGNDSIVVDASVTLNCRLYGDAGTDTLSDMTRGRATIVSIGGGTDTVKGNGLNTSYWVDGTDTLTATSAETASGGVHIVKAFYQPFTTDPSSPNYVPSDLTGPDLTDPTDGGATTRLANASLWGTGPVMADINQGGLGDCYYLATLAGMANTAPHQLANMAVDLGDGTYAVRFDHGGVQTYVRVDGDLPAGYWNGLAYAHPGDSGAIWGAIMEKAYAFYRRGENTYDSLTAGWMGYVLDDLGIANTWTQVPSMQPAMIASLTKALATGHVATMSTNITVSSTVPVVGSHAYTLVSVSKSPTGALSFVLRNPWGFDGKANSSDPSDGLITLTAAEVAANFSAADWAV